MSKALGKYRPVIICGPSASGKSTILSRLLKEYPKLFKYQIGYTSREPRPNENEGIDFYFKSRSEMEQLKADGKLKDFNVYYENMYGLHIESVDEAKYGDFCSLFVFGVSGIKRVKEFDWDPLVVHIRPPSIEDLRVRIKARGTETEQYIKKRMESAESELEFGATPGNVDYVVVNKDVDEAYEDFKNYLMTNIHRNNL